jgi:hypothetical protein
MPNGLGSAMTLDYALGMPLPPGRTGPLRRLGGQANSEDGTVQRSGLQGSSLPGTDRPQPTNSNVPPNFALEGVSTGCAE